MMHPSRDRHGLAGLAGLSAGLALLAIAALTACGGKATGGAIATFTPPVTIAAPASSAAAADAKTLAKACAPPDPATGKPAADPVAALLSPGDAGKAARKYTRDCMDVPAHDWPALASCFATWGAKIHAALKPVTAEADKTAKRELWGVRVLDWCRAYARGTTRGVPQPVLR